MSKKQEEVTVEILEIKEKFSTELTENLTTMNLSEMIKEAQYIVNFNLSEQFCFQFANTLNFLATRGSKIIDYATKQNNYHLIFHRGIESQKIMEQNGAKKLDLGNQNNQNNQSKIVIKETNMIQKNSVFDTKVIENIKQPQQTNQIFNQNDSNKNGVQIGGGGVTYSQHIQQMLGPSQSIQSDAHLQINQSSQDLVRQIDENNSVFQTDKSKQSSSINQYQNQNNSFNTQQQSQNQNQNGLNNTQQSQNQNGLNNTQYSQIQNGLNNTQYSQIQNGLNNTQQSQNQSGLNNTQQSQIQNGLNNTQYSQNQNNSFNTQYSQNQDNLNNRLYSQNNNISLTQNSKIQIQQFKKFNIEIQCEESKYNDLLYYLTKNSIQFKVI